MSARQHSMRRWRDTIRRIPGIGRLLRLRAARRRRGMPKIFGIGHNKTGTTSLAAALRELGFQVAPQPPAVKLIHDWAKRDFQSLIEFCCRYDAFQDVPFSLPFTYQALDQAFPGSKFILTVRDSPEQWFQSLVRSHAKRFDASSLPTAQQLKDFTLLYKGRLWEEQRLVFGIDEESLYDRDLYLAFYERYNRNIRDYFRHRSDDFLELNVGTGGAYGDLCRFLGKPCEEGREMPWKNRGPRDKEAADRGALASSQEN